jgi:pyruvate,water dikinase
VAFSADPLSGRRCVIIEAAAGRVDGVVSGMVTPARWVVDARGEIADAQTPDDAEPPLPPGLVLGLATAVRRIAAARGVPVDVEWLHDGERFWFLQARPITSLAGKRIYSSRLVADMSPGLIKPLLWSTNTRAITHTVFERLFTELIGPSGIDYSRLVRRIHSRLYADVTQLGELLVAVGLPANFFEMMARDERGERPRLPRRSMVRMLRYAPFLWRRLRVEDDLRRFVREQDAALAEFRQADWSTVPIADLREPADRLLKLHGRSQWFVFLAAFNLMLRRRLLERSLRSYAPGRQARDLLRGQAGLKALEPNEMLQTAGELARRLDPSDQTLLDTGDDPRIRAALADSEPGRELVAAIDEFMRRYGFLSANGTDFSSASWVERPALIWQSVARHARNGRPEVEPPPAGAVSAAGIAAQLPLVRRRLFRRFLTSTRAYLDLRERVSLLFSEDTYQFRRVVVAMGDQLVGAGRLADRDDVFYLYRSELWRLVGSDLDDREARRLVAERRAEMAADAACEPEETLCGEDHELAGPAPDLAGEHLVGIGGSPGTVEGIARIVRDPLAAPADLGPHDILVVPFTDVGWTPLMAGTAGIVAEAGGQLSHTAIVAREYGLPAVLGVRRATQVLRDGEAITLDGRRGRVHRGHVLARKEAQS